MRSEQELLNRIQHYKGIQYMYSYDGYIAWQTTTGENIEILFIEVPEPGKGLGTRLMGAWLKLLFRVRDLPYYSVSVTRLKSNEVAGRFYRKLGFVEHEIVSLYAEPAILSTISFEKLCRNLSIK